MFSLFDIIAEILLKVAYTTITPNLDIIAMLPRTFQAMFGLNLLQCFKEDLNIENKQPQHKKDGYHFDKRTQIIKY
jgi:hypothetical protein